MDEPEGNALASVAPDWIPLATAEAWLTLRFEVPARSVMLDLVRAMRAGDIAHRVPGIDLQDLRLEGHHSVVVDPPGLGWADQRVQVIDWDAAKMDWPFGTVEGKRQAGAARQRLTVELYWPHVEDWANIPLRHLRETRRATVGATNATGIRAVGGDISSAATLGRPPKHDWDSFWIEIAFYASANDLLEVEQSKLQEHMVQWTAVNMKDPAPHPATIGKKIARLYKTLKRA